MKVFLRFPTISNFHLLQARERHFKKWERSDSFLNKPLHCKFALNNECDVRFLGNN